MSKLIDVAYKGDYKQAMKRLWYWMTIGERQDAGLDVVELLINNKEDTSDENVFNLLLNVCSKKTVSLFLDEIPTSKPRQETRVDAKTQTRVDSKPQTRVDAKTQTRVDAKTQTRVDGKRKKTGIDMKMPPRPATMPPQPTITKTKRRYGVLVLPIPALCHDIFTIGSIQPCFDIQTADAIIIVANGDSYPKLTDEQRNHINNTLIPVGCIVDDPDFLKRLRKEIRINISAGDTWEAVNYLLTML